MNTFTCLTINSVKNISKSLNVRYECTTSKLRAIENIVKHEKPEKFRSNRKRSTLLLRGPLKELEFDGFEYYFENGLRKVYPYLFTYSTFCKARWENRELLEVFCREFRFHSKDKYEKSILSGRLKVNRKTVAPNYKLRTGDLIENKIHRHECPVLAAPIRFLHLSDELIVIDKPPSIPVHECGRFHKNSITYILNKEHGLKELSLFHRLDRLTSGVLILGRNRNKVSEDIEQQIRDRKIHKEYLCRVQGEFPCGNIICDKPINCLPTNDISIYVVHDTGKECITEFQRLSYNGKSSVVLCRPLTGRTHQIRVHLQYLGHPIINDPVYRDPEFGSSFGKGGEFGKTLEQLSLDLITAHKRSKLSQEVLNHKANNLALLSLKHYKSIEGYSSLKKKYQFDPTKIKLHDFCYECQLQYPDPQPHHLIMYLHAWKYKGNNFYFESAVPVWAKEEWNEL